jgi:hypothetical protein
MRPACQLELDTIDGPGLPGHSIRKLTFRAPHLLQTNLLRLVT